MKTTELKISRIRHLFFHLQELWMILLGLKMHRLCLVNFFCSFLLCLSHDLVKAYMQK